ncbi:hypothetical protein LXA43DRAFT_861890, partial [Ganoderma leucocontextum]
RTHLPLLPLPKSSPLVPRDSDDSSDEKREWYLVILKCEHDIFPRRLLCRVCYTLSSESGPSAEILYVDQDYFFGRMLFALSPSDLEIPGTALEVKTVYLPHPERVGTIERSLGMPHKTIKLSLLGSVRRALQARGYTVHLEGPSQEDPCTHSLTIFNAEHTIVAKFLHDLSNLDWDNKHTTFEKLAVVARVSLTASTSPPSPHDTSEAYQDGPHMVAWWDIPHPLDRLWKWKLGTKYVVLTTAAGESLVLRLGLDLAWQSEYSLQIEVVNK